MDILRIAKINRSFYMLKVSVQLWRPEFAEAVVESLTTGNASSFDFGDTNCPDRIIIDTSPFWSDPTDYKFRKAVGDGLFKKVTHNFPRKVDDTFGAIMPVEFRSWRFVFTICMYTSSDEHGQRTVEDPLLVPDDERLGRLIELKISRKS